jgi:hypothetical protein
MPRAKKKVEPQLQVEEQTVSIAGSLVPLQQTPSSGTYRVAKDVVRAITDDDLERNGVQLSLFVNEKLGIPEGEITAKQLGIRFESSSAYKLFGILLKKHADTIEIKDGVARQVVENASGEYRIEICSKAYPSPFIEVSEYELVKEMVGSRKESGRDYEDFRRAFNEVRKTNHCFSMKLRTSRKDKDGKDAYDLAVQYASVITHVVYPNLANEEVQAIENELEGLEATENSRRTQRRLRIYLHPVTIHSLGRWFTLIPNDFEEKLTEVGAGKSSHIRQLAYYVLGERGGKTTRSRGYFELTTSKLIAKLQLEKYRTRRKDLDGKLAAAFDALKGWLIYKVEFRRAASGGYKYRIWPLFDSG